MLNERLAAIKNIWTDDTAEFHGEYVDFAPIFYGPKPVQHPHPPIYIGVRWHSPEWPRTAMAGCPTR